MRLRSIPALALLSAVALLVGARAAENPPAASSDSLAAELSNTASAPTPPSTMSMAPIARFNL